MKFRKVFITALLFIVMCGGDSFSQNGEGLLVSDESMVEVRRLHRRDPRKFRLYMAERREEVRARLEELKARNPEEYRRVVSRHKKRLSSRLERLRRECPERFERLEERRCGYKEKGHRQEGRRGPPGGRRRRR